MKAPLTMPTQRVGMQQFELQRVDYASPEASGRFGGVQAGFPLWSAVYTLTNQTEDESDDWRAFWSQLRGSVRRFYGYDFARQYPKEYADGFSGLTRAGGGSFDGTATSWTESVNADGDQRVTLNGLPANFVISKGDYIGFSYTATEDAVAGLTWHFLVRAVEAKTANGSGVLSTLTVEPPLPDWLSSASATAYLNQPKCVMAMIPDQSSLEPIDRRYAIGGGQIVGVQDVRE